ncbi:MAG: helix-turn-helix transcriptional regulator [Bacteroidales bacterium]|nr:helix-turn-helix transcriptional regulator [Bacteroidales bacterium]
MKKSPEITQIEVRIMNFVKRGHTNKYIASSLNKSTDTIKYHLKRIYRKLGAENRVRAINKYNELINPKLIWIKTIL